MRLLLAADAETDDGVVYCFECRPFTNSIGAFNIQNVLKNANIRIILNVKRYLETLLSLNSGVSPHEMVYPKMAFLDIHRTDACMVVFFALEYDLLLSLNMFQNLW